MDVNNLPPELAVWLEHGLKTILEGDFVAISIAGIQADGTVITGYYHCDVQDKVVIAHNIYTDALKDTLYENIDELRDWMLWKEKNMMDMMDMTNTTNKTGRTPDDLLRTIVFGDEKSCIEAVKAARDMYMGQPKAAAETAVDKETRVRNCIKRLLTEVGVPVALKGYRALEEAIYMVVKDPSSADSITKVLYPMVAKTLGGENTGSRVERAMRHGIEVAMDRGDINVIHQMFGNSISYSKGKPTNSEFIARMAQEVFFRVRV